MKPHIRKIGGCWCATWPAYNPIGSYPLMLLCDFLRVKNQRPTGRPKLNAFSDEWRIS